MDVLPTDPGLRRAALYSLLHRGNDGDIRFYVDACHGARSVLELGCGSGRVLGPLIATQIPRLVGVDTDPDMLALARLELELEDLGPARLVRADMRAFDLGERFDRIVIPFNGLYALATDEDFIACLRCAARHLEPGGRILLDCYPDSPDADPDEADGPLEPEHVVTILVGGARIEVFERELPLPLPQSFAMEYRYDIFYAPGAGQGGEPSETTRQTIRHHYLEPAQVPRLLERAGLELEALWGDFDRGPFTEESTVMAVSARVGARSRDG